MKQPRRWSRLGTTLLAAVTCAAPAAAVPDDPRTTLIVTRGAGAEGCPDADDFVRRIQAISPTSSLQTNPRLAADTWIYLELTHDLGRYGAFLQTRGKQQGSRTLSDISDNCASLSDAIAVTLALLLDPGDQKGATPHDIPPPPTPPPTPTSPRARERNEPSYAVTLGGGVSVGLLAEPAPWATGSAEMALGQRIRLSLGAATALPQRAHYLEGYTELGLAWGYARACAVAARSQGGLELSLCLSPMVGVLSGRGQRYDFSASKRWVWAALAGGSQISGALAAPSFWWLSSMIVTPLTRQGFSITVDGEAHDTFVVNSIAATASMGMGVRF